MLTNLKDLRLFHRFLTLVDGRVGQVVNYTSLGNDAGVSSTTVKTRVSVLSASFVIFEHPLYSENVSKRVIKSPKLYCSDPGLVAHLVGIETAEQAGRDPASIHDWRIDFSTDEIVKRDSAGSSVWLCLAALPPDPERNHGQCYCRQRENEGTHDPAEIGKGIMV